MANENGDGMGAGTAGGRTAEQERDELANAVSSERAKNTELANALRFEQAKNEILVREVVALEDEVVDRCLGDFEAVVGNASRGFWREQLLTNREPAMAALRELAGSVGGAGGGKPVISEQLPVISGTQGAGGGARRPLHNRALSRPVAPTVVGGGGRPVGSGQLAVGSGEELAVKIRNRAHELRAAEGIPFQAAFRRAEREIASQ